MVVALRHRTHKNQQRAGSGQVRIVVGKSEEEGGGGSERKGSVEINSLKKRAKKHCYHGMLCKRVWKPGNMRFC